jgi:hypothetical protein
MGIDVVGWCESQYASPHLHGSSSSWDDDEYVLRSGPMFSEKKLRRKGDPVRERNSPLWMTAKATNLTNGECHEKRKI